MANGIIIASSDTVGELVSDFAVYPLCDLPLAQPFALMKMALYTVSMNS